VIETKPKGCPFCPPEHSRVGLVTELHKSEEPFYYYQCSYCDCQSEPNFDKAVALENWNTRPIEDQLKADLGEMVHASICAHEQLFYTFDHDIECSCPICTSMDNMTEKAAALKKKWGI